jgi:UDP-N-acetylmuramate dehydrogenase
MKILEHQSLRLFNTFGVDVKARYFVALEQVSDIEALMRETCFAGLPTLILGGGSNVVFRRDFPGVVIHIGFKGIEILHERGEDVVVRAAAGESWHGFVQAMIDQGYAGLENLSLIPGSVGAAPVQNIGAYGVELREVFDELEAVDLETGETRTFDRAAAQFGYRDSFFKSKASGRFLITSVTFRLPKQASWQLDYRGLREKLAELEEPLSSRRISEAICQLRCEKLPDPVELGNVGSFFKNPVVPCDRYTVLKKQFPDLPGYKQFDGMYKLSAAWLIDHRGWKGYREGDAGVSPRHALVLVNYGNATGESIWQLAQAIMASVKQQFNIALEPEPRII